MHNLRRRGRPRLFCFYTQPSSTQHNGEYFQKIYNHIILGHVSLVSHTKIKKILTFPLYIQNLALPLRRN